MNVFVLCTCRRAELLAASTLVFETLRVGYPTARVTVFLNAVSAEAWKREIVEATGRARVDELVELPERTIHHEWIESLVSTGRLIPEYFDPWANCITRPRLHGCHLWIRPSEVRAAIDSYRSQFPETPFNPGANLFYPVYLPYAENGQLRSYFHDTCCLLYHAIGGEAFAREQLDCYDHLNCGTISDLVGPHLPAIDLAGLNRGLLAEPRRARGLWRDQERYYREHASG